MKLDAVKNYISEQDVQAIEKKCDEMDAKRRARSTNAEQDDEDEDDEQPEALGIKVISFPVIKQIKTQRAVKPELPLLSSAKQIGIKNTQRHKFFPQKAFAMNGEPDPALAAANELLALIGDDDDEAGPRPAVCGVWGSCGFTKI